MIDYHLKFLDEAAAVGALFDGDEPKYTYIDQIGVIYSSTGILVDGWHVNVRTKDLAPELDQFVVEVNTPARVWL